MASLTDWLFDKKMLQYAGKRPTPNLVVLLQSCHIHFFVSFCSVHELPSVVPSKYVCSRALTLWNSMLHAVCEITYTDFFIGSVSGVGIFIINIGEHSMGLTTRYSNSNPLFSFGGSKTKLYRISLRHLRQSQSQHRTAT